MVTAQLIQVYELKLNIEFVLRIISYEQIKHKMRSKFLLLALITAIVLALCSYLTSITYGPKCFDDRFTIVFVGILGAYCEITLFTIDLFLQCYVLK